MGSLQQHQVSYRDYVPAPDSKIRVDLANLDAYQWADLRCNEPFVKGWMQSWKTKYDEPYRGITTDGQVLPNVYRLATPDEDFGAPTSAMVDAAQKLLQSATQSERNTLCYPIDAPEWRRWINPEIYAFRNGVRLEEASSSFQAAADELLRTSLSPSGYAKARGCMKVNHFLGEVLGGPRVLNENSYNIAIFGEPDLKKPWGWHLYGHHLVLNFFVVGSQQVVSPVFMGAEPNIIDIGPSKGLALFTAQEDAGLAVMQSLDAEKQRGTRVYEKLKDDAMPEWRFHRADQRHLGGAFQDNRIVPYEGTLVSEFTVAQQNYVRNLLELSLDYLPEKVLKKRIEEIEAHWSNTHFCWIGGSEVGDAFYYKIHSPVIMLEFDHHSGVFLNNKEPLPFHIHTLVRTPNGNDYGKALLSLYKADGDK